MPQSIECAMHEKITACGKRTHVVLPKRYIGRIAMFLLPMRVSPR
ncbi:MAG: hypothetical protein ABIF10_03910 [Candidatus Woesearchaeota archaeon]